MPVRILRGDAVLRLGRHDRTLMVTTHTSAANAELVAVRRDNSLVELRRPRPGMVLLPDLTEPLVLQMHRRDGQPFADGVEVTMVVATDPAGGDEIHYTADLSAMSLRELVRLESVGTDVLVTGVEHQDDLHLPPLGDLARRHARSWSGRPRLADNELVRLVIALDVSTSMASWVRTDIVRHLVDVVAGVGAVIARPEMITVPLAPLARPIGPARLDQIGLDTASQLEAVTLRVGVDSMPLFGLATGDADRICMITDGSLTVSLAPPTGTVLIVLAESDITPLLAPMPENVQAVGLALSGDPATMTAELESQLVHFVPSLCSMLVPKGARHG